MKEIPLTKSALALVDDEDFAVLSLRRWHLHSAGYASTGDGKLLMHRAIMQPTSGLHVDHIDGNRLNNQRHNLRLCTHAENRRNHAGKRRGKATSQFTGVGWWARDGKWRAKITVNGKTLHLGYFVAEVDAARAYNQAATVHFGEFATLNKW